MKESREIIEVYPKSITDPSNLKINYVNSFGRILELSKGIETAKARYFPPGTNPMNLPPEKRLELQEEMKLDRDWRACCKELMPVLIELQAPEFSSMPLEDQVDALYLPDWNELSPFHVNDRYDASSGRLEMDVLLSHSYMTQFTRVKKIDARGSRISSNTLLLSSDHWVVFCMRAGGSLANTVNNYPGGMVGCEAEDPENPDDPERNPVFNTIYRELLEEAGINRDDLVSVEIMGKVTSRSFGSRDIHIMSRVKTSLDHLGVYNAWDDCDDRNEHRYPVAFPDDPSKAIRQIRKNSFDPSKADPDNPFITTRENGASILPHVGSSLLMHYAKERGEEWAMEAQKAVGDDYQLILL